MTMGLMVLLIKAGYYMLWTWIITIVTIIGTIFNIQKSVWGYVLWLITDLAWVYIDWRAGLMSQAFVFLVMAGLAAYGIYKWSKDGQV